MLKKVLGFLLGLALLLPTFSYANHAVGHNGVLLIQEWSGPGNRPGGNWSYNTTELEGKPTIDCSVTPSPSGGCALKFTYAAGTYSSSMNGGRAAYSPIPGSPTDLYIGSWQRYSSNFVAHPNGWKAEFYILAGTFNGQTGGCRNIAMGWSSTVMTAATQVCWATGRSPTYLGNVGVWDFNSHRNQWVWVEKRVKVNTPGVCDGTMQQWMNDVLYMDYQNNVCFRQPGDFAGIGSMQHTAEYGGGGSTIAATQYWYVDHTVFSTQRIGMPGGVVGDVTPPPVPNQPTVSSGSSRPVVANWLAVSAADLAGYRYYRKNESCSLNTLSYAVIQDVGNTLTITDTTVPANVTSVCIRATSYDTSTNESLVSTGRDVTFSVGNAANVTGVTTDTTGADITISGLAYKIRYWDDLHDSSNKVEVTGLGGVSTYRLSKIWEPSITFMCVEAQGSDGVWETDVLSTNYRCRSVVPGTGDITAPVQPTGLKVR